MAKPICIVKIDNSTMSEMINIPEANFHLRKQMEDYHVFVVPFTSENEHIKFEVFHEKDFTEIQYEELKSIIEKSFEDLKEINKK